MITYRLHTYAPVSVSVCLCVYVWCMLLPLHSIFFLDNFDIRFTNRCFVLQLVYLKFYTIVTLQRYLLNDKYLIRFRSPVQWYVSAFIAKHMIQIFVKVSETFGVITVDLFTAVFSCIKPICY